MNKNLIFKILGPAFFTLTLFTEAPEKMEIEAFRLIGITIWMAIWWIAEVVPIAVTALLPIVLFPTAGVLSIEDTGANYGHKYIFLFIGGFMIANAIQKWNLHRRIALTIIRILGSSTERIILGFMMATAFLSMWISNTATTVMMLPIGLSVIAQLNDHPDTVKNENKIFGKALMLGIAYSASAGGIATLIGTPPNMILAGFITDNFDVEISFFQWLKIGLPISIVLLFFIWFYLTKVSFKLEKTSFPGGKQEIKGLLMEMGPMKKEEKRILFLFGATVFCWITRSSLIEPLLPNLDDSMIAIASAILLFIIPSANKKDKLMNWKDAVSIPWGILILFGGGLSIAKGFEATGLANWLGMQFDLFQSLSLFLVLALIITTVNFLTEISSNMATTAMLLPVILPLGKSMGVDPFVLLTGATLAASCAFMLPVATPPNAVVFGSKMLKISDMVKAGLLINVFSIILILLATYFLLPVVWA
ncbi:MAG: anion transporter [Crocinitomicaceae bacterium]|nr:anion transporter [Crocinitomicaceae bacterium]